MSKKFQKSEALTFRLVHQGDQTVLMPVNEAAEQSGLFQYERKDKKKQIQADLENDDCYFPADGYDYDKHLRSVNQDQLFESDEISAHTALAHAHAAHVSAAQREVLDALDDDAFVAEDVDDFFHDLDPANLKADLNDVLWGGWKPELPFDRPALSDEDEDEEDEEQYSEQEYSDSEYSASEYSDSESEFLRVLEEYEDIGAGDYEEEGENDAEDAAIAQVRREEKMCDPAQEREEQLESKASTLRLLETMLEDEGLCDRPFLFKPKAKPKFDCESVLSLRSNLSNHPGTISTISTRTSIRPVSATAPSVLTPTAEEEEDEISDSENPWETIARLGTVSRVDTETAEERKLRKAAVKEAQREARKLKKTKVDEVKLKARVKAARFVGTGDVPEGVSKRRL